LSQNYCNLLSFHYIINSFNYEAFLLGISQQVFQSACFSGAAEAPSSGFCSSAAIPSSAALAFSVGASSTGASSLASSTG